MALLFPSAPTNGQVYTDTVTGYRYIYNSTTGVWTFSSNNVGMTVSSTPPANVASGAMWFNREIGRTFLYYNDGDSNQWVETVPAGTIDTNTIASYVNPIFASLNLNWTATNTSYSLTNAAYTLANTSFANTSNASFNGSLKVPNGTFTIGTTTFPVGKFHVLTANGEISRFTAIGSEGGYHVSYFDNSTPWYFGSAKSTIAGNINDLYIGSGPGTTNNLIFGTAGTERVRIDPVGNVTVPNVVSAGNLVANRANVDIIYPKTTSGKVYVPGHVIQVVQYNYTGATSIATGTYTALPITANITPTSTSSKILVRCVVHVGATGGNEGLHGRLYRNGSVVPIYGDAAGSRDQAWFHCGAHYSAYEQYPAMAEYLDSPASTSTLTYTIYARGHSSPYVIYINTNEGDYDTQYTSRTVSSITLMEIAQ